MFFGVLFKVCVNDTAVVLYCSWINIADYDYRHTQCDFMVLTLCTNSLAVGGNCPAGPSVGDSKPSISGKCIFKRDCAIIVPISQHLTFENCVFDIILEDILRPLKSFHSVGDTIPS